MIPETCSCYDRITMNFQSGDEIRDIKVTRPDGNCDILYFFDYQPIHISYDEEGIESVAADGNTYPCCRYTPDMCGSYEVEVSYKNGQTLMQTLQVEKSSNHGYIEVSKKDSAYFAYTDGTPFFAIGINMAFPTCYGKSNGKEFGLSGEYRYIGLKQYEAWIKQCSKHGVNIVRVWIGHEYFSPDTEHTYEFNLVQFSKIDCLVEIARKYDVHLKLTIEQFRGFDYEKDASYSSDADRIFRNFHKRLYHDGKSCTDNMEWLTEEKYRLAWLAKTQQLAIRYSGDPMIFCIELWNEMNCFATEFGNWIQYEILNAWNKEMLKKVKEQFPRHLVTNSLGSLDSPLCQEMYEKFCWEYADFMQMHRYLDQGAEFKNCTETPIEMITTGIKTLRNPRQPLFVAETGAVENHHSGPFKYYSSDHRGILFADMVYTPVFLKSCGAGNIWHWDNRYIESKNLYWMFEPIKKLVSDVDFQEEDFKCLDASTKEAYVFLLLGNTTMLAYVRNKSDSWKNTLRDLNEPNVVDTITISVSDLHSVQVIPIWQDETASLEFDSVKITLTGLKYGLMLRAARVQR